MGGGGYSVLVNYQTLQLKYRSISPPPQSFFSIKYRQYGLLLVSFIEHVVLLGGEYSLSLAPIGLPAKMQNKENTTFLALLRPSFALE